MGAQRINLAIEALNAAGFRAERGYPGGKMPEPASPVVAVSLGEQTREEVTILARVYCGKEQCGAACEDTALGVAAVLKTMGANCVVGSCEFQGKLGLYCVEVTAVWPQIPPVRVLVGNVELPYVTAVTARQSWETLSSEDGITTVTKKGWSVSVEEMLPPASFLMEKDALVFTVTLIHEAGTETYESCYWDSVTSQVGVDGVFRKREAWTWKEPVITRTEE